MIKYTSSSLNNLMQENEMFALLILKIDLDLNGILQKMSKLKKEDYCLFITITPHEDHSVYSFNDGGATYNDESGEMETFYYGIFKHNFIVDKPYELYYEIENRVLCFLSER